MAAVNELTGTIPTEFGRLTNLTSLKLGKFEIIGSDWLNHAAILYWLAVLTILFCKRRYDVPCHKNDRSQPTQRDNPNGARTTDQSY
jgi:hypothetical protein